MTSISSERLLAVTLLALALVGIAAAGLLLAPVEAPVSATVAEGESMGHDGQTIIVHSSVGVGQPQVGDSVVFEVKGRLVNHRLVERTDAGFLTQGDDNSWVDQEYGPNPPARITDAQMHGQALVVVPLGVALGGLLAVLLALGLGAAAVYRRQLGAGLQRGPASLRTVSDHAPTAQQTAAVAFALVLILSGVGPFASFGGLVVQDHSGTASAVSWTTEDTYTNASNTIEDVSNGTDNIYTANELGDTIEKIHKSNMSRVGNYSLSASANAVHYGSDGYVYGGGGGNTLHKLYPSNMTQANSLSLGNTIYAIDEGPNGYLYVASYGNEVVKVDPSSMSAVASYSTTQTVYDVSIGPDGYGYAVDYDGVIHKFDPSDMSQLTTTTRSNPVRSVEAGDEWVYAAEDNQAGFFKYKKTDLSEVSQYTGHSGQPNEIYAAPDGYLYSVADGIHRIDPADLTRLDKYTNHSTGVTSVVMDHSNLHVYSGDSGGNVHRSDPGTTAESATAGPTGQALDQNGDPVANATVVASYDGPNVSEKTVDGTPYQEIEDNPTTNLDQWQAQLEELGVENPADVTASDWQDALAEQSDARVVAHPAETWDLSTHSIVVGGTTTGVVQRANIEVGQVDASSPQFVYDDDEPIMLSCWEGTGMGVTQDSIDSDLPGETQPCAVTVEQVDPLNDTVSAETYESQVIVENWAPQNLGTKKHHGVVLDNLDQGVYRVTHNESGQTTMLAVSPNGEFESLTAEIDNWASDKEEWTTEWNQRMADIYGDLPAETTTTNETGHYTLNPPQGADTAHVVVMKSGAEGVVDDPINESKQTLRDDIETATVANFNDETNHQIDFQAAYDARQTDETFRRTCRDMQSVTDVVGAPYYGDKRDVAVSGGDFDVTGDRLLTKGLNPASQTCAALNFAEQIAENGLGSVFAGLPDDLSGLTEAELEELVEPYLSLFGANPTLKDEVEERTGVTLDSENPTDYTRSDLETLADEGVSIVDDGTSDVDTGDNTGGGGIPTGGGSDAPNIGDGSGSVDEAAETLSQSWPVANVDDWSEAGLVIRITNGQGETVATLGQDSEYVTVDDGPGADTVTLDEYPISGDANAFAVEIDVVTPDGAGDNAAPPVAGPGLNGQLPDTKHIRVSTLSPGAGESVSISAAGGPNFGTVEHVNVTKPDGTTQQYTATDGEATFETGAAGDHRVAVAMSNAEGETVTEVLTVTAGTTSQGRPATIIADSGVTGRFAVVSNGLQSGSIETADGNSDVRFVGVFDGDPGPVSVHATGISAASDTTYTVDLRKGEDERAIQSSPQVLLHMPTTDSEAIYWRNGRAIPKGEQGTEGTVQHRNESSVAETYYDADAGLDVRAVEDPGIIQTTQHWIDRNIPPTPFSLAGAGAVGLAVLPAGAVVGRRYL